MKILFDHCMPAKFRAHLAGHDVALAGESGWSGLANGILLDTADAAAFDALLTIDKNIQFQQRFDHRRLSVVLLDSTDSRIEALLELLPELKEVLIRLEPGQLYVVKRRDSDVPEQ